MARTSAQKIDTRAIAMRAELARRIAANIAIEGDQATQVPGLRLYRRTAPSPCASAAYEPRLIVFVQGQKRINLGPQRAASFLLVFRQRLERRLIADAGQVRVDLPVPEGLAHQGLRIGLAGL